MLKGSAQICDEFCKSGGSVASTHSTHHSSYHLDYELTQQSGRVVSGTTSARWSSCSHVGVKKSIFSPCQSEYSGGESVVKQAGE